MDLIIFMCRFIYLFLMLDLWVCRHEGKEACTDSSRTDFIYKSHPIHPEGTDKINKRHLNMLDGMETINSLSTLTPLPC